MYQYTQYHPKATHILGNTPNTGL